MSALRTWALTVLVWGAMATLAEAGSIPFLWDWSAWVGRTGIKESVAAPTPTPTPTAIPTPPSPPAPLPAQPVGPPDAYLNFGTSGYPEQSVLTIGTAQPWYTSAAVAKAFGH